MPSRLVLALVLVVALVAAPTAHAAFPGANGVVSFSSDRDETMRALAAHGVPSKPYMPAIHLMSFYRERFGHREGEFPVCEDVAARSLSLPFFPEMTEGQVAQVAEALESVVYAGLK